MKKHMDFSKVIWLSLKLHDVISPSPHCKNISGLNPAGAFLWSLHVLPQRKSQQWGCVSLCADLAAVVLNYWYLWDVMTGVTRSWPGLVRKRWVRHVRGFCHLTIDDVWGRWPYLPPQVDIGCIQLRITADKATCSQFIPYSLFRMNCIPVEFIFSLHKSPLKHLSTFNV